MMTAKNNTHAADISDKRGILYNLKKHKALYLMMLPALISAVVFGYAPMCGIIIAFKDFNIMKGILGSKWVGLENFEYLFTNPDMLGAVKNTLIYGFCKVFLSWPFPVILALMYNEIKNRAFKKTVQTIGYMPYFLSWISVAGLLYGLFALEGPVNSVLKAIIGKSYEAKNIMIDPDCFLGIYFWSDIWKNVGWSSIVYLAAITGIDATLFEAAEIDGCGRLKQVLYIILPSIKATIIIVFVMSLGGLVNQSFDQVYGLQNVFTQDKTEVINTLVYRIGIQSGQYSRATAFGLMQGVITLALMLTGNYLSKKIADVGIV